MFCVLENINSSVFFCTVHCYIFIYFKPTKYTYSQCFENKGSSSGRGFTYRYYMIYFICISISSLVGRIEHTLLPNILLIMMHAKHTIPCLYVNFHPEDEPSVSKRVENIIN